ncbi:hypothetical protein CONLIGDRAFT_634634 [Coniochaeta ligniaria NRRL 30616]|uniref:UBZ4-type domain-containing protein n=1 Tax=Coniochaeta ligniaria NRRL 30616 TaxID=1408157 RepID=A0A1J7IZ33_9PEZI|nr:hypothetical protein CONLIGDRAFT_634634 [Coniochaeta ligniaria NRRL 30616]
MHRHHTTVPTTRQVIPGAGVNIVLKQDQPTGRTVSGTVRDVLTRGNHPRGIKVRLADGRVGRVQSIASGALQAAGEEAVETAFEGSRVAAWGSEDGQAFRPRRDHGRRTEEDEFPPQQIGLDAYIKPAKQKGKRRGNAALDGSGKNDSASGPTVSGEASEDTSTPPCPGQLDQDGSARCPVCNDFEGDEAAVAHHVASHFDA